MPQLKVTATFTIGCDNIPLAETILKTVMHDAIDSAANVIETHDCVQFATDEDGVGGDGIDYTWEYTGPR